MCAPREGAAKDFVIITLEISISANIRCFISLRLLCRAGACTTRSRDDTPTARGVDTPRHRTATPRDRTIAERFAGYSQRQPRPHGAATRRSAHRTAVPARAEIGHGDGRRSEHPRGSLRACAAAYTPPRYSIRPPTTASAPPDGQRGLSRADSAPARQETSQTVTLRRVVEGFRAPSSRAGGGCTSSERPYSDRLDPSRCRLGKPTPREARDTRKPPPAASMGGSQRQLYGRTEMPLWVSKRDCPIGPPSSVRVRSYHRHFTEWLRQSARTQTGSCTQ